MAYFSSIFGPFSAFKALLCAYCTDFGPFALFLGRFWAFFSLCLCQIRFSLTGEAFKLPLASPLYPFRVCPRVLFLLVGQVSVGGYALVLSLRTRISHTRLSYKASLCVRPLVCFTRFSKRFSRDFRFKGAI